MSKSPAKNEVTGAEKPGLEPDKPVEIPVPRFLLVGMSSGVGTTTVAQGLVVALKRKGTPVAVAKIGSSLVDVTHHRRISGRLAHTLDFWMLSQRQVLDCFARLTGGAELILVEGEEGLFDELPSDCCYRSIAEFAQALKIPVVLLVKAQGMEESIAALVHGYSTYHPELRIRGVIANWVDGEAHNQRLKKAIERLGGPAYLGGIPIGDLTLLADTIQGSGPDEHKSLLTRNRVIACGDLVQNAVDIPLLRELASRVEPLVVKKSILEGAPRRCRIAVADDAAFHLTIQDNLDLIRRAGAELVAFSPLADVKLPSDTSGIYFPDSYTALYAQDLQTNEAIRNAIREFAENGGVIYAEANSVGYLCRRFVTTEGEKYAMAGVIPGFASTVSSNQDLITQYCELQAREETVVTRIGDKFRGVRIPRLLIRLESKVVTCFQLRERHALLDSKQPNSPHSLEGLSPFPHVIATTIQAHWGSNPKMAQMFVDSATAYLAIDRKRRGAPGGETE